MASPDVLETLESYVSQNLLDLPKNPTWNILEGNLSLVVGNISWILNFSLDFEAELMEKFRRNRRVNDQAFYSLIFAYSILILVGATGNLLVVIAVIRKKAMRTARNVFIINLAASDLHLCLVTMPLTLVEVLSLYWPLGDVPFFCKLVGTLQATSVFVSTISITAIALDRYQVIVYPTKTSLKTIGAVAVLPAIWIISFVLALPNFIWRTLKKHEVNLPNLPYVTFCFEEWPHRYSAAMYSAFIIIVQYCLPILTVTVAYSRICRKLEYRLAARSSRSKSEAENKRLRKTNVLLVAIALVFCLSWLPLNLYNLVVDFADPFGEDTESKMIVYAVCHMMGMSSACSNPLLYGWLNENFRKEFREIFHSISSFCFCKDSTSSRRDSDEVEVHENQCVITYTVQAKETA